VTNSTRRKHFSKKIAERRAREREMAAELLAPVEPEDDEIVVAEPEPRKPWRVLSEEESAEVRIKLRKW
jgi:hypothetical protein